MAAVAEDAQTEEPDHYGDAATGLEAAAKALRARGGRKPPEDGSSDETPRKEQPQNLKSAAKETKRRFAQARGEKPRDEE